MKNKKSIAMAMAAVSTLGAVAPAFADNVESRILVGNESVDVRLASGYTLKTVEGKTVVAREKIYNYNGAPNDRSKHTLKNEFKDCKILIEKLGTTPNKDVFVLGEKVTDTVSVSQETAKLNALNSEIATYVANGYTKEEKEIKGSITGNTYVPGNKVVTLKKGQDTKKVTFTNIDVLKDADILVAYGNDDLLKALQSDALLGTVPAVKNGAVALIEDGSVLSASCTPSALSIPATIDEYLEILGAAASKVR